MDSKDPFYLWVRHLGERTGLSPARGAENDLGTEKRYSRSLLATLAAA